MSIPTIVIVMLAVQAAMLLVAAYGIGFAKPKPSGAGSRWARLGLPMVIVAAASWQIADRREGSEGAELLQFGGALLLGMALATILMLIRERRGLGAAA